MSVCVCVCASAAETIPDTPVALLQRRRTHAARTHLHVAGVLHVELTHERPHELQPGHPHDVDRLLRQLSFNRARARAIIEPCTCVRAATC